MNNDQKYMAEAIKLAKQARPSPNPRVGAVIVLNKKIVGRGFHKKAGMPHAEVVAIKDANEQLENSTLYVTLEPCCHQGRTGPCTSAILEAGINNIVVGMLDPDKRVSGQGISFLKKNGCNVKVGVLEKECEEMVEGYSYHRNTGDSFIHLKAATTLDGYIASISGDSKWITSIESRKLVHKMRGDHDAILIGSGTQIADDPSLTVRDADGINPIRIVMDTSLTTQTSSKLLNTLDEAKVILVHSKDAPKRKKQSLSQIEGVELLECPTDHENRLHIKKMLLLLQDRGILSIFVEGGEKIHSAFLKSGYVSKISLFIAPKILGDGLKWSAFSGITSMSDTMILQDMTSTKVDSDILIQCYTSNSSK